MENDILDTLNDVGYKGPMLQEEALENALNNGPKSLEYTVLVEWIAKELRTLYRLDEHVNAITTPDDSSSFLLELSSFLKELGCPYTCLTEGHLSERLNTRHSCALLLDFLLTELETARMVRINRPESKKSLHIHVDESTTASVLKSILLALKFPKPPAQITPEKLFEKVENKLKEVLCTAHKDLVGRPLFTGVLSSSQWQALGEVQSELQKEYRMRRQMLIKRLDVTIQSFQWSDRIKNQENEIASLFQSRRQALLVDPDVHMSDLLSAREDLAIIEKTSSAGVRRNTQSVVNKVMIGTVPDRGGRPCDTQAPAPEMPSWQKDRVAGDNSRGRGGGGRGGGFQRGGYQGDRGGGYQGDRGGGSGERGGRVQGGWSQGGGRGRDEGSGQGGGGWGRGNRGGRGGYQQR